MSSDPKRDELARASDSAALVPALLESEIEAARGYATQKRAQNTRTAYAQDWKFFDRWCVDRGAVATEATPELVAVYLASMAASGKRPSGVERALAGIAWSLRERGITWPKRHHVIESVMSGIRRTHGTERAQKTPIADKQFVALVEATPTATLRGIRDRAMLCIAFFGAFRRSEVVALDVDDLRLDDHGWIVRVRRSKSDQDGKVEEKGISYTSRAGVCPVRTVQHWIEASGVTSGALFRSVKNGISPDEGRMKPRELANVVKRAAIRIGLDPRTVAGHSLRAGFASTAAKHGKGLDAIMRQTLHKDVRVARGYIRHAQLFDDNASTGLF